MKHYRNLLVILIMSFISSMVSANAFDISAKVIYVEDGDTLTMLVNGRDQIKVRLASIDAPETSHTKSDAGRIGQPYSNNSGQFLKSLTKGKMVDAQCFEQDKYKRYVCDIFVDGQSVNAEMVRQGWAWANNSYNGRYLRDKALNALERGARDRQVGLWAERNPTPPWNWRSQCWDQGRCS